MKQNRLKKKLCGSTYVSEQFLEINLVWIPYPAVVVGRRSLHDGADKKGLIAVDLFLTSHDAEAQAARGAPSQDDVFAAVQMPAWAKREIKNTNLCTPTSSYIYWAVYPSWKQRCSRDKGRANLWTKARLSLPGGVKYRGRYDFCISHIKITQGWVKIIFKSWTLFPWWLRTHFRVLIDSVWRETYFCKKHHLFLVFLTLQRRQLYFFILEESFSHSEVWLIQQQRIFEPGKVSLKV